MPTVPASMSRLKFGFVLCVISLSAQAGTTVSNEPRAWLVTNGETQAVLVGESHMRTTLEFDAYYKTVVKPSFDAAHVALLETYEDPQQIHAAALARVTPCALPATDRATDRLAPAMEELVEIIEKRKLPPLVWHKDWRLIPEFLLASTMFDYATPDLYHPAYAAMKKSKFMYGVSWQLYHDALGSKQTSKLRALDKAGSLREHFCKSSASERQDYVVDKVIRMRDDLRMSLAYPRLALLADVDAKTTAFMLESIACAKRGQACTFGAASADRNFLLAWGLAIEATDGNFLIYVKRRTQAWVPIITQAMQHHKRSFVIVGAMHLPDLRVKQNIEPGLISLLRSDGYAIRPIANAARFERISAAIACTLV